MVQAYILIQADLGKATAVAAAVREIPGVTSCDDVTGPYDVIARAEAETLDALGSLVVAKIQETAGIMRTLTCTVVHP
ncbi:Lrp/AsnC family transcriptional regulator [Flexivirga caeni]|uniref:Lrp/AsnC family transcriptional regulator n=1 Tax=Flexivirga caeni TaxID=2294115 RepID=A0A3M9MEK3_9MICO|nr:Lrp/AsnC ligand binding domain-containing protein [Flexivirga caeni]RNI23263.1 Lrp/AsnC family transcriptional regulator [Flexivirga caeni]